MIKCIEDSEVTMHSHLMHIRLLWQEFQYIYAFPKSLSRTFKRHNEYPHLLLETRRIPMKTNENAMQKNIFPMICDFILKSSLDFKYLLR